MRWDNRGPYSVPSQGFIIVCICPRIDGHEVDGLIDMRCIVLGTQNITPDNTRVLVHIMHLVVVILSSNRLPHPHHIIPALLYFADT